MQKSDQDTLTQPSKFGTEHKLSFLNALSILDSMKTGRKSPEKKPLLVVDIID
jgi:hypothetical protein